MTKATFFVLCLAFLPVGCSSIKRFKEFPVPPQAFGGTRNHIEMFPFGHAPMLSGGHGPSPIVLLFVPFVVVDIPLSLSKTKVTAEGIARLKAALPNCRVIIQ
jgi:hypothetical protein